MKVDPRRFVFSCSITCINFSNSLCDYGSKVNVMPRSIAEKLRLRDITIANLNLVFGDFSEKTPEGLIHDLQLVVGNCIVPTDFNILEMGKKLNRPLILGRPFLDIVGVIIVHANNMVAFANIKNVYYYRNTPTITKEPKIKLYLPHTEKSRLSSRLI